MSYEADIRENLIVVAKMMPLSDREETLAQMMFTGGEGLQFDQEDHGWWGEDALKAWRALQPWRFE